MKNHVNISKYFRDIFERRVSKNTNYSLRAFARDLDVPSPNLSRVLSGERGFSKDTLSEISKKLGWNETEKNFVELLNEKQFGKSTKIKKDAAAKLRHILINQTQVNDENVAFISDWYHMAILALMDSNDFISDAQWIAARLNIHEKVVESAMDRLIRVGAVQKVKDKWLSTGNLFIDPKNIPNAAVKEFHHQIIKKADDAIDFQNTDERDISSIVFCFNKDKIKDAKDKIKKFREEFELEFGPDESASNQEIYGMSIQFFRLSEINK